MQTRVLNRLANKLALLQKKHPLSPAILNKVQDAFTIERTYHSVSIEGNTLSLGETQLILREGLTIGGKTLREHFEVKNYEKGIFFTEELVQANTTITSKHLLKLHEIVLDNIDSHWAGRYRNGQVRLAGSLHLPPNARRIPEEINQLMGWIKTAKRTLNPIILAARAHHRLVHIHPFFDGNGRTGRLFMNALLMQAGYPPAIILQQDRYKYYDALEKAHRGETQKIELVVAQAAERSLDIYLQAIASRHPQDDYVPLSKLSKQFSLSQEYLSLLARQGKIDAYKNGRNWVSNQRAVKHYLASVG